MYLITIVVVTVDLGQLAGIHTLNNCFKIERVGWVEKQGLDTICYSTIRKVDT
jgi:hypothetical protein